jgi:hypothetical protein
MDKVTARSMIGERRDGGRSSISCVPNVIFRRGAAFEGLERYYLLVRTHPSIVSA